MRKGGVHMPTCKTGTSKKAAAVPAKKGAVKPAAKPAKKK
jgi:hypothetical protein